MKTLHLTDSARDIERAAKIIKKGGLVAFPTETVYGLGGSATDSASAGKIYSAKGRPSDNPLIIHVTKPSDAEKYAYTTPLYYRIAEAFCPGPITMILKKKDVVPYEVTGGLDTVAVRIPSHPVARAFIEACGVAIAAPSANLSGSPSPTCPEDVAADMDGRIDAIIYGGRCDIGVESTIIKLDGDKAVILRPGAVTEEMLGGLLSVSRDETLLKKPSADLRPLAPGMKYRHYAPKAPLYLLKGPHADVAAYMKARLEEDPMTGIICTESDREEISGKNVTYLPDDPQGQARELFNLLRGFDKKDAPRVYSVIPSRVGLGLAVYNRLIKAAGYNIIRVGITIPVIGLTGQSGAGKSTASKILQSLGAFVCDCDEIYHGLLYKDSPLTLRLAALFPEAYSDGTIDRRILSGIVFSDKEKLMALNGATHGAVLDRVREMIKEAEAGGARFAAVDAPQLFESGYDSECTAVIGICAPLDKRLARLVSRDGGDAERIRARLENQHNEDFFRVYCDEVIDNTGTPSGMTEKLRMITDRYTK